MMKITKGKHGLADLNVTKQKKKNYRANLSLGGTNKNVTS